MAAFVENQMGNPFVFNEEFYNNLDQILEEVNKKCVKMDEEMKKKYVNIILEVVKFVIEKLKTDDDFNQLYSKLEYVGSYFDGLRVAKPTEFDLNLIMKLPFDYRKILIENNNVKAGFVKINVSEAINSNPKPEKVIRTIQKWCDDDGYLLENRVRQWMEGIMTRCFGPSTKDLTVAGKTVSVTIRKSGPAFTFNVNTGFDVIDVDFVFTLQFSELIQPPSPIRWSTDLATSTGYLFNGCLKYLLIDEASSWVVVPKPTNDPRFWRVSFTYSERKLMLNKYKLKLINRFLKALRDARNLQIPSYFIKTVFLWEAHECNVSNRPRFWEKGQGFLFIYMLNKLYTTLKGKKLPYYWHKKLNLFDNNYTELHVINMANQISRIILKINDLIKKKDKVELRSYVLSLFNICDELAIADLSLKDTTEPTEQNISCSIS